MIKKLLFLSIIFISSVCFAQVKEDDYAFGGEVEKSTKSSSNGKFDWNRVTIGGGLGMTFGSITYINISPTFGYYLTDNFVAGTGGIYTYYSDNVNMYSTHTYGARIFSEYFVNQTPIMFHAETEWLNLFHYDEDRRIDVLSVLLGGGIRQKFGDHSYIFLMALWNVNESKYKIYANPRISLGIAIGL